MTRARVAWWRPEPRHWRSLLFALGVFAALPASLQAQDAGARAEVRRLAWLGSWLAETSGLVASRAHPGILWSHNDSGNPPELFAIDTLGQRRARFELTGLENRDWEDLALGPCPAGTCLYLADTGDNGEDDPSVRVYRFPEPDPSRPTAVRGIERVVVRYPDRPRDVEAMFVGPDTSVHLVTKGRQSPVAHYQVPAAAWHSGAEAIAEPRPITTGIFQGALITGAALAPDGRTVAILTYRDLHRMRLEEGGALVWTTPAPACSLHNRLPQAEAVTWVDERTVLVSSEQRLLTRAQVTVIRCPW